MFYVNVSNYYSFSQIYRFQVMVLTFSIVRLCFNIGAQPVHLSFKANSTPIVTKASNSTEPCTHTGTWNKVCKCETLMEKNYKFDLFFYNILWIVEEPVLLQLQEIAGLMKSSNPIHCNNCYGLRDMLVNPQDVSDENQISHYFYLPKTVFIHCW